MTTNIYVYIYSGKGDKPTTDNGFIDISFFIEKRTSSE